MNNLSLPQVAPNQNQKELTINDQAMALDAALTDAVTLDVSAGGVVVSPAQFTRAIFFIVTGAAVVQTVELPNSKRLFALSNTGAASVTLTVGGSTLSVAAGASGFFYSDGAALVKIA